MKRVTPCAFFVRNHKEKYRKVIFTTLVRKGCHCVERTKTHLESCDCKHKKRHQVIPCPKMCSKLKHCPKNCQKIKKWFIYKFEKFGKSKKCKQKLYKIERKKCCKFVFTFVVFLNIVLSPFSFRLQEIHQEIPKMYQRKIHRNKYFQKGSCTWKMFL